MPYLSRLQHLLLRGKLGKSYLPISTSRGLSTAYEEYERSSQDALLGEGSSPSRTTQGWQPWWHNGRLLLVIHGIIIVVYLTALTAVLHRRSQSHYRGSGLPYSPAVEVVYWENRKFSLEDRIQDHGSFSGRPSPQLDKEWHDLLNYENIVLEPEYIEALERQEIAVAVPEGTGYLGTLNVYHELHCLKRIHQFMYPDYYFPDLTPAQHEMNRLHNEHCIDFLRQASMCHGDIGLITYEWKEDDRFPIANATSHQCVNWEKLDRWTRARSVDMMRPGWLVHPRLGVAYPDGQGDKLGATQSSHNH